LTRHHRAVGDYLQERLYRPEVESLPAMAPSRSLQPVTTNTAGADLQPRAPMFLLRNFYVAFPTFVGI
jgi:hypothetical protein